MPRFTNLSPPCMCSLDSLTQLNVSVAYVKALSQHSGLELDTINTDRTQVSSIEGTESMSSLQVAKSQWVPDGLVEP